MPRLSELLLVLPGGVQVIFRHWRSLDRETGAYCVLRDRTESSPITVVRSRGNGLYQTVLFRVMFVSVARQFAARVLGPAHPMVGQHTARIVILGGGFGGVATAKELQRLTRGDESIEA